MLRPKMLLVYVLAFAAGWTANGVYDRTGSGSADPVLVVRTERLTQWVDRTVEATFVMETHLGVYVFDLNDGRTITVDVEPELLHQIPKDRPVQLRGSARAADDIPRHIHSVRTSFVGTVHVDEEGEVVTFRPTKKELGVFVAAVVENEEAHKEFVRLRSAVGGNLRGHALHLPDVWLEYMASYEPGIGEFSLKVLAPPELHTQPKPLAPPTGAGGVTIGDA